MTQDELRKFELVSGLAAGVCGVILPSYQIIFVQGHLGTDLGALATLICLVATAVAVAAAAYWDSRYHSRATATVGLAILWSAAGILFALELVMPASLKPYILPQAILTLIAAISATVATTQAQPTS